MIRRPLNERAMITAEYFDRCVGLLVDNMGVVVPVSVNLAVIETNSSRMTALEWKADIEPGRLNVRYRPEADCLITANRWPRPTNSIDATSALLWVD
jgi:hypothetical protein